MKVLKVIGEKGWFMFFVIRFLLVWAFWLVFADKKRWRELLPVGVFAGLLGATSDNIITNYKLWEFHDSSGWSPWMIKTMDDWGIYMVCPYLFIQWLPKKRAKWRMIGYWFMWSMVCMGIEWVHVATGHMTYYKWWSFGWSFVADWVLLWLFFQFHRVFKLEKAFRRLDRKQ